MDSTKKAARIAGLLYLVSSLPAPFSLLYIPSVFIVRGDVSATASKIRASELLFRTGIVAELISATLFILAVLSLYYLLKRVNEKRALLMLILVLVSVPISFLNEINRIAALTLVKGPNFLSTFDQRQLDAMAATFLNLHGFGLVLAQIFWGLWLLPFGLLVFRSTFLPRILGVLLIIAGISYVASSLTSLLFPTHGHIVFMLAGFCGGVGELSTMFWLVIKGAQDQPLLEPA